MKIKHRITNKIQYRVEIGWICKVMYSTKLKKYSATLNLSLPGNRVNAKRAYINQTRASFSGWRHMAYQHRQTSKPAALPLPPMARVYSLPHHSTLHKHQHTVRHARYHYTAKANQDRSRQATTSRRNECILVERIIYTHSLSWEAAACIRAALHVLIQPGEKKSEFTHGLMTPSSGRLRRRPAAGFLALESPMFRHHWPVSQKY